MGIELARAYVSVAVNSTGVEQSFREVEQAAEQSMGNIKRIMTSVLGMVGSYLGAGTIWKGLEYAGQFEETKVAFETMIGTAEETEKTLADLTEFAAKTPFEMPGIQQVARGLLTFGERGDEMMDTLKVLGDASGGTAVNFQMLGMVFNQVRGVGKLLTQDFRQLSTRGILFLTDIAKYYNVTEAEASSMLSKGKIAFEDVKEILRQTTMEGGRNFKMMERQSKTYKGLMSTLSDNIGLTFRAIGEGILPASRIIVSAMDKVVNSIREVIVASGAASGNIVVMTTAIISLTTAVLSARTAMKMMGLTFKQVLIGTGWGIALVALGVALGLVITGVQKLYKWLTSLQPVQEAMARMAERLSIAWQIFKTTMVTVGNAIWTAIKQVADVILNYFGINLEGLPDTASGVFVSILDTVSSFAVKAASWFGAIVENWRSVWPVVTAAAGVGWQAVVEKASWAWGQIGVHARAAMAGLQGMFVYLAGHWKGVLAAMVDVALLQFTAIAKGIGAAIGAIDWSKLGAAFGNLMKTWAAHQWGMISGLSEVFNWLMDSWKSVLEKMLNAWKAYATALPKALYAAITSLASGGTIGEAFAEALDTGMSEIGTAIGGAFDVGAEAGQKFADGYSAGVQEAQTALGVDQTVWESLGEIGAQAYAAATAAAEAVMTEADAKISALKTEMEGLANAYSVAQQQALADEDLTFEESDNLKAMRERLAKLTTDLTNQINATRARLEQEAKDALEEKPGEGKKEGEKKKEDAAAAGAKGERTGFVEFGQKIQDLISKSGEVKTQALLEEGNNLTKELPEKIAGAMAGVSKTEFSAKGAEARLNRFFDNWDRDEIAAAKSEGNADRLLEQWFNRRDAEELAISRSPLSAGESMMAAFEDSKKKFDSYAGPYAGSLDKIAPILVEANKKTDQLIAAVKNPPKQPMVLQ